MNGNLNGVSFLLKCLGSVDVYERMARLLDLFLVRYCSAESWKAPLESVQQKALDEIILAYQILQL